MDIDPSRFAGCEIRGYLNHHVALGSGAVGDAFVVVIRSGLRPSLNYGLRMNPKREMMVRSVGTRVMVSPWLPLIPF